LQIRYAVNKFMNNIEKLENTISDINKFCNFIDKCADSENSITLYSFLVECQAFISKIYASICEFPNLETEYLSKKGKISDKLKNTRLQRFYFVSGKIKNILGENDLYWNVFNPYKLEDDDPSQSRLSNDIAEIYDDFISSLEEFKYYNLSNEEKLDNLKNSFEIHWYDHACKALTSISWLLYNKIDWDENS